MSDWDVFISHAREDKVTVALPLADLLRQAGLRVWVDAQDIRLGDSLTGKINEGLASSRYGVVVLSPSFLAKEWPKRELAALLSIELQGGRRVLPVLHDLQFETLLRGFPLIADRFCVSTSGGLGNVASEICRAAGFDSGDSPSPTQAGFPGVGSCIVGYDIDAHIGTGGSGIVYRVRSNACPYPLALKLFHPLQTQHAHLFSLFSRGFQALAAIRHPNVIAVHDHGEINFHGERRAYLTMDLIDGLPLDAWSVRIDPRNRYRTLLPAFCQLAAALAAAHDTTYVDDLGFEVGRVLHGDLKPANVLVDKSGFVRLIDFLQLDVNRLIDQRIMSRSTLHADQTTKAMGTPGFMAPEQERHGVVTVATDIYGLGITFAHALAAGTTTNPVIGLHRSPDVPASFRKLVGKMVARQPGGRPPHMRYVLDVLERERGA